MKHYRLLSGAAVALGIAATVYAGSVEAGSRRLSSGAAAALGIVGGFAAGAAIASAAGGPVYAAPRAYYAPPPPAPVYVERAPIYVARPRVMLEETCHVERRDEWVPGWGWQTRRRTVCD
jgi:hypothetical protein